MNFLHSTDVNHRMALKIHKYYSFTGNSNSWLTSASEEVDICLLMDIKPYIHISFEQHVQWQYKQLKNKMFVIFMFLSARLFIRRVESGLQVIWFWIQSLQALNVILLSEKIKLIYIYTGHSTNHIHDCHMLKDC